MGNPPTQSSRPQKPRNNSTGSWIMVEKEAVPIPTWQVRSSIKVLKHSATMPLPLLRKDGPGRTLAREISRNSPIPEETSIKNASAVQWIKSGVSNLATAVMNHIPSLSAAKARIPTFRPDIEVRSKRGTGLFRTRKWEEFRVVLDTACEFGNWVSLATLKELGIEHFEDPTDEERLGVKAFGGAVIVPRGAVSLKWRGITGRGPIRNCSQNFTSRFLVVPYHPAPFAILLGSDSIKEHGLLYSSFFIAKKSSLRVLGLPREVEPTEIEPSHEDLIAENQKAKEENEKLRATQKAERAARKRRVRLQDSAGVPPLPVRTDSQLSIVSPLQPQAAAEGIE